MDRFRLLSLPNRQITVPEKKVRKDPLDFPSSSEKPMAHWKIAKFYFPRNRFCEIFKGFHGMTFSGRRGNYHKTHTNTCGDKCHILGLQQH